jgi:uncharacterized protein YcaQ
VTARTISRDAARLFLVRRHLLAPPRSVPSGPNGVMAVFERLGSIQFDPIDVAGRNHDLVLLARVAGYRREWTDALLYEDRRLFEAYNKGLSLLPTDELPWYRMTWDRKRERHERGTFGTHAALVEKILGRIRAEGPLSAIEFESGPAIDWYWRPTNQVRAILEALAESGLLGLARRRGNRRYYDLVERLFSERLLENRPDLGDQRRHRLLSRFRAHGLLGRAGSAELWVGTATSTRTAAQYDGVIRSELMSELLAAGSLVPVFVNGIRGERYLLREEVASLDAAEHDAAFVGAGRNDDWQPLDAGSAGVAFLAPLDPFVWDRELMRSLFGFEYVWEVYVPEPRRRWGYYVLPILWGDRLVGRIELRVDRAASALRVVGLWWEMGFEAIKQAGFVEAFGAALEAHRAFAGVGRVLLGRTGATRGLREALPAASVGR